MCKLGVSLLAFVIALPVLSVCWPAATQSNNAPAARVDGAFIRQNDAQTKDWPTIGLDYAETRFSKLKQIDDSNVKDLGLVWSYDLESTRGVEATPLVIGGVMYVSAPWSIVHAIDARTGKRLWVYDPKVPRAIGYKGCCDVVNRGVAVHKGKVYVGAYDGRLIAIDTATGKKVWETDTVIDHSRSYTITGAPRVFKGNVVIGNGGAMGTPMPAVGGDIEHLAMANLVEWQADKQERVVIRHGFPLALSVFALS